MPSRTARRSLLLQTCAACLLYVVASAPSALACPDSDKLLEHMISAHGGMNKWSQAPTISWEDEFLANGVDQPLIAKVVVEQGRRRAYLDYPGTNMSMTWDGEKAFSENWALPFPPRFMALLNYHFLNLPWLAADPGVKMSEFGRATLPNDSTEYFTMKLTYEDGVGDTPRDYYKLYVDPDSHLLKACEYIVTYSALLPEGVEQSPPNTLVFETYQEVDHLLFPSSYSIYQTDGTLYGSAKIRNWSIDEPFDAGRMNPTDNAVLDTSEP